MMQGMGFGMGFGWLVWLLLIGAIIWAVKAVMDSPSSRNTTINLAERNALDILKERYARGEIGSDEYEEKRKQST